MATDDKTTFQPKYLTDEHDGHATNHLPNNGFTTVKLILC